ncbi:MAG: hypothetical protein M0Z60_10745 [Nitrospiraceae bacterium]|nr:hypothetical protein [Nitrospiraceae bacterium]
MMLLAMAGSAQAFTITGKVVSIDRGQKTLGVAAYYGPDVGALSYNGGPDRLNTFALKHGAKVMKGTESLHFGDIRVGDWVTVDYYQSGSGLVVADGITITTPPKAYLESAGVFSIPGQVVAVDRDARTLTLDTSYYYGPSSRGSGTVEVFAMNRDVVVMRGNEPRDFRDIRTGDWVTITYHQSGSGRIAADDIAITAPPAPFLSENARMFSIPGKVVAIDRDARSLTLDPSYCYGGEVRGLRVFALNKGTVIMMGNESRDFRDVRVGDWVTVNFHEDVGGLVVTDGIAFTSPEFLRCSGMRG